MNTDLEYLGEFMGTVFYAHLSYVEQFNLLWESCIVSFSDPLRTYCLNNNVLPIEAINFIHKHIFYDIPLHNGYRITQSGRVASIHERFEIIPTLNKLGYPAVTIHRDGIDRSITGHVHRLLALTFIELPNVTSLHKMQVNHLDGIKKNNDLPNLEWCTDKDNCLHAYEIGLRETVPVVIRCATTGNEFTVKRMQDAGKFFGVTTAAIHWQLNCRKSKAPYKGYYLRFKNDIGPSGRDS